MVGKLVRLAVLVAGNLEVGSLGTIQNTLANPATLRNATICNVIPLGL